MWKVNVNVQEGYTASVISINTLKTMIICKRIPVLSPFKLAHLRNTMTMAI